MKMKAMWKSAISMSAVALATAPALAQDAPAETARDSDETIVVTGLKSPTGTQKGIKRDNIAIVDGVTADQIDRQPDASLAEALDRVAGVSTVPGYNSSEARNITVRGFDSRYNSMGIDGNPIWNSSRNNRGTQSDIFPASVVNQALVYKTYTPDQDANSIGAHVEMRTLRAFDGGTGPWLKARASVGFNELQGYSDDDDNFVYRVDAVGKFTFGPNNQFGVVLGVDWQENDWYDKFNQIAGTALVNGFDVPASNLSPSIYERQTTREAYYGKLETRATDELYAFVSANYYRMREDTDFFRGGVFVDAGRVRNPTEHGGDFVNGTVEAQLQQYELDRSTWLLAGGLDYRVGDRGALTLRGSYTDYDHFEVNHNWDKFQVGTVTGSYQVTDTGMIVSLNPLASLANPANWRHRTNRDIQDQFIPHEDHVYSLRADYEFNDQPDARGLGYKVGAAFRRLDRDFDQTNNNYRIGTAPFTLADVLAPGQTLPLDGLGPVIIDGDRYADYVYKLPLTVDRALASDYKLMEDVFAGHGALTFTTDRLRALVGARIEHTRFTNDTSDTERGVLGPVTRKFDYTRVLPNAQISYDITRSFRARAAVTRAMGRPDFNQFAQGQQVTFDSNGYPIVQGSNPYLEPRMSWNFDLSFERYFRDGFFYAGLFYKDLQRETFTQRTETRDGAGVVILTETLPVNNGTGTLRGAEVGVVLDKFNFLPAPFDGLHFEGNYTRLDGEWNVVFTDGTKRSVEGLRNQPKWMANLNLGWKIGPADLNLGWKLRGRTFTGTFGTTAAGDRWIDGYDRLDAQASFEVIKGVQLFAEARNLTNSFWVEETGRTGEFLYEARNPGRSYYAGVKFKY